MPDLYGHLTPQGVLNGSLQTIVYANNYNELTNKPSINSVELQGNKTAADLGLLTAGDIPVESVNGKQGVVILDGDDIEYEAGTSVNSKITDLEAEIGSGPVVSVNGQQGVVELDGTDINYSLTKTLNQKIDEVAASIPVVSYPVTSVNTKTGDVVLDGDDIDYAEGVSVNSQIDTLMTYIPVYGNTASGAIATFDTSLALPLQDCTIEINAVQESGTPTPQDSKAISGFTGANIRVVGSNLWDEEWEVQGTFIWSKNYIPIKPNTSYYRKSSYNLFPRFYDNSFTEIGTGIWGKDNTFTTPSNASYMKFMVDPAYGTTYNNDISINYPATDTAYHAYNANSTTTAITWQSEAGTVYGGSLDVTSGVLTVTMIGHVFDGTENFISLEGGTVFAYNFGSKVRSSYQQTNSLNTHFTNNTAGNSWANVAIDCYLIAGDYYVGVNPNMSLADYKTWLGTQNTNGTHVKAVATLQTPVTYQLTPTQISAIVGTNNVFADTNGDTSVVFACSLKDYIEGQ